MKVSCSTQPNAQPTSVPHSPIQTDSGHTAGDFRRLGTQALQNGHVLRMPFAKRRLANVIAAAASTTAREPASSKNPCALSSVSPILGCAPSTESNRWPCPNCGSTHSVNAAIASDVPLATVDIRHGCPAESHRWQEYQRYSSTGEAQNRRLRWSRRAHPDRATDPQGCSPRRSSLRARHPVVKTSWGQPDLARLGNGPRITDLTIGLRRPQQLTPQRVPR